MNIPPDKLKHFIVGILMGLVLQATGWWLLPTHIVISSIVAFTIIVAISYGFELFSKITGHGHYEIMDAVASAIGGLLGMGMIILLQLR